MSFIKRVVNLFWRPLRCVGRDLEGNRFYEHPSFSDDPRTTRRVVQYKHSEDVWSYISGGKRLPVQWSMWLSHTRQHPPTLEELQRDLARRRRVLDNAAAIEARDLEDKQERIRIEQNLREENVKRTQPDQIRPPSESDISAPSGQKVVPPTPAQKLTQGSSRPGDEPEAWSPQALRRGA